MYMVSPPKRQPWKILSAKVLNIIPELLELNGIDTDLPELPVHIMTEQVNMVRVPR